MLSLPFLFDSMWAFARIFIFPRPVSYACFKPSIPKISPAVGKSGPFICFIRSSTETFSSSIIATRPSIISTRLWGGILVAIPTAIPSEPLTRSVGTVVGKTAGSFRVSSKFGSHSTVSFSRSFSISPESLVMRDSVYLIAAALSPSIDPKLPCPSTSSYLIEKFCAIRTRASYTELSPCGWYFPKTSPTIRADFLYGLFHPEPSSLIPYNILLCTGFRPSLTSGSARETITDIE